MTSRIVIIGGGQAGGWAAKTLRDEGFDGGRGVGFLRTPAAVQGCVTGAGRAATASLS